MLKLQKTLLFFILLTPFLLLIWDILNNNLIDPIEEITNPTGQWALRFILLSLTITPLVIILKKPSLIRFRRMIGVFGFFYLIIHLSIWLIDQQFNLDNIFDDIKERTYILLGFVAFIFTTLLAITSTNGWIKRLGRKWRKLHRLNYLIVVLAWVHLLLQSKEGWSVEIGVYLTIILILFTIRLLKRYKIYF